MSAERQKEDDSQISDPWKILILDPDGHKPEPVEVTIDPLAEEQNEIPAYILRTIGRVKITIRHHRTEMHSEFRAHGDSRSISERNRIIK